MRNASTAFAFATALGALVAAAPQTVSALEYEDIEGKWCGETTDYTFTRNSLRVEWRSDGARRSFRITRYDYEDDEITVHWRNAEGEEVYTVFGNFRRDRMVQKPNDNGPRRPFRRC